MPESWLPTFLYPGWLLLLPLVWLLGWRLSKWQTRPSGFERICDPHLLAVLTTRFPSAPLRERSGGTVRGVGALRGLSGAEAQLPGKNHATKVLVILTSIIILLAAGPSWRSEPLPLLEPVQARVVIMDLSRSMLAEDVRPNRHQQAQQALKQLLIQEYPGHTALLVVAGGTFVVAPLTQDQLALQRMAVALAPDTMPADGNQLDVAIQSALRLLEWHVGQQGQIIIISDGTERLQESLLAANEATGEGFQLSVLAIGSEEGAPLRTEQGDLVKTAAGKLVFHQVDMAGLQALAQAGNGVFARAAELDTFLLQLRGLSNSQGTSGMMLQTEDDQPNQEANTRPVNAAGWLVWFILPLVLYLFRRNVLWLLMAGFILQAEQPAYADWSAWWMNDEQRAYVAYQREDYDKVHVLSEDPQLRGLAYYRRGDYAEAAKWFVQEQDAISQYHLGNALARQQQFQQAIAAYRRAIKLQPDFTDAQHNLELIQTHLIGQGGDALGQGEGEESEPEEAAEAMADGEMGEGQGAEVAAQSTESGQAGAGAGGNELSGDVEEATFLPVEQRVEQGGVLASESVEQRRERQKIERWLQKLDGDPSELLRRKFLRDFQERGRER